MLTIMYEPRPGCGPECRSQQLVHNIIDAALDHSLRNTSTEVCLEDVSTDPVQRTLHRRNLVEHIDAVTVLLHHADHPIEMTAGRTEPEPHRAHISPHRRLSRTWRRSS
jgi:hypothetical protein